MSAVFENPGVNWSKWAQHADPRTCEACEREFAPNHPRRRFCGATDCPGRQRRRAAPPPPRRRPRSRNRAQGGLTGVMAEVLILASTDPPVGSPTELAATLRDLIDARQRTPAMERAATMRLLAVAATRAAALTPTP